MGTMIGFVLGYVLGTKAGPKGFEDLQASWQTISSSDELRDMLSGGLSVLRDLLQQGRGVLADKLANDAHASLRRVA